MPKRTIETGVGTYLSKNGIWSFGLQGEEVSVHKDDVERFDRFNTTGAAAESAPVVEEQEQQTDGTGDDGGNADESNDNGGTPEPYEGVNVKDLKALIVTRNEGREDADKISPEAPGNRAELVAALVADDGKNTQD